MDEGIKKYSITIAGHRTSVTLEPVFWEQIKNLADREKLSVNALVEKIDKGRKTNLSSALRVYVLENLLNQGR